MTGGIDLFAMKGVSSSSRLTEDMGSSFLKCVGSLDLPPFCQTGKRAKKVLQTILASLYTYTQALEGFMAPGLKRPTKIAELYRSDIMCS